LRLIKTQQIGYGLVDVTSSIAVRTLRQMTQDGVMEGCLRREN
jgi:hypothetical protein